MALPLVLAVLTCLLAVSIPFSVAMRGERRSTEYRWNREQAEREAHLLQDLAAEQLSRTALALDESPWFDSPEEFQLDARKLAQDHGFGNWGPKGRLWTVDVEDYSRRIDLNGAPVHVVARGLGLSSRLAKAVAPGEEQLVVEDGSVFGKSGFVWVNGEVAYFGRRDGHVLTDLIRPALVPGVWDAGVLPEQARSFPAGEEVLDFRGYLVATAFHRWGDSQGDAYETVEQALSAPALAKDAVGGLDRIHRQRLQRHFRVSSAEQKRHRWVNPQRLLSDVIAGETRELRVSNGIYFGSGDILRLRTPSSEAFSVVVSSRAVDREFVVTVDEVFPFSVSGHQAVVEVQRRAPIHVNTCEPELLALLWEGLPGPSSEFALDEGEARAWAERLVAARPLDGLRDLDALLEYWEDDSGLPATVRQAIFRNAHHAGDSFIRGTLPFRYDASGLFEVTTSVSLNFPLSGREKARHFVTQLVDLPAAIGRNSLLWQTQRDFEESWRLTRRARGWTTFPENLHLFAPGAPFEDPPGRTVSECVLDLDRFAAESTANAGARLAPGVLTGAAFTPADRQNDPDARRQSISDLTISFDRGPLVSADVDGWPLNDGPPPPFPVAGAVQGANPAGTQDLFLTLANQDDPFLEGYLKPFGFSMWWNPGEDPQDGVLANISSGDAEFNRVVLELRGGSLEFTVNDAVGSSLPFQRDSQSLVPTTSTVRYDFADHGGLEPDTWYHLTAFCRGSRPSQMSLFVDHRARGVRDGYGRLPTALPSVAPVNGQLPQDGTFAVAGAGSFPANNGVVRIGAELVEYVSFNEGTFQLADAAQDGRLFGGRGRRGTLPFGSNALSHPETTGVELYGYSTPIASDNINEFDLTLNGELPRFHIYTVDPEDAPSTITVKHPAAPAFVVGEGYAAGDAGDWRIRELTGQRPDPNEGLQRSGGYLLLIGWNPASNNNTTTGVTVRDDDQIARPASGLCVVGGSPSVGGGCPPLGGAEIVRYGSFQPPDRLLNVERGGSLSELSSVPRLQPYLVNRTHLTLPQAGRFDPDFRHMPLVVVPISVRANNAPGDDQFVAPEMLQIGQDYSAADQEANSTEWVRYDVRRGRDFLRANDDRFRTVETYLHAPVTSAVSGRSVPRILEWGLGFADPSVVIDPELESRTLNAEGLEPGFSRMLGFRGVLGTYNCRHDSGSQVLPVFRVYRRGFGRRQPKPGRHDLVHFLQGGAEDSLGFEFINYAWSEPGAEAWGAFSHVALRAAPGAINLGRSPILGEPRQGDADDPLDELADVIARRAEVRNVHRIAKYPSGEMPVRADRFQLGSEGELSAGAGKVDELRVFSDVDPDPAWLTGMLMLDEQIEPAEEGALTVHPDSLLLPDGAVHEDLLEGFDLLNRLPQDGFLVQMGDEVIACLGHDNADLQIADEGRGVLGSRPGFHHRNEPLMLLPWFVVSRLAAGVSPEDAELPLQNVTGFPRQGFVNVGDEVIGYTHVEGVTNGTLRVPSAFHDGDDRRDQRFGVFRGRYGTNPQDHPADSLVYWMPHRYPDWYAPGIDIPELGFLELSVPARRGWFESVTWGELNNTIPSVDLVMQARVMGRGGFHGDPQSDPDLFFFDESNDAVRSHRLGRAGDLLRLRFFTRYEPGALDPEDMSVNGWKSAPVLSVVGVEFGGQRVVERHQEH